MSGDEARLAALRMHPRGLSPSTQEMGTACCAARQSSIFSGPPDGECCDFGGMESWDKDPAEAQIHVCLDTSQEYLLLLRPAGGPGTRDKQQLGRAAKVAPRFLLGTTRPT